jgi:hypothetical protein
VAVALPLYSTPYSDTDKEIRLYIKGTIEIKVHTMQNPNITVTRSIRTHVARAHTIIPMHLSILSVFIKSHKTSGIQKLKWGGGN